MADNSIFAKLKKIFSNDVIIRNIGGKKLKVIDTSNLQNSPDSNTLKDRFNRLRSTNYGVYSRDMIMSYQSARIELFKDYDVMAMDPVLSSALDIYADESTTEDAFGNILTIKSEDENIKEILHNLFYDILNIDFNLWSWVHSMCKYGDAFLKIDISSEYGVFMVHPLSAYEVYRIETVDENNSVTYKFRHEGSRGLGELENYEVAHFRLLSDANFLPYGRSMMEGARRVWKQLCLHENSDIWTDNGYKKIKNIVRGDIVYSYDYEKCKTVKTKVKNCLQTGVKSTYKLKTRSRELILTEDHPVLVKDKNDIYSYKEVKNLSKNDYIVVPTLNTDLKDSLSIKIDNTEYFVKLNEFGKNFSKNSISRLKIIERIKNLNIKYGYRLLHSFLQGKYSLPIKIYDQIKNEFNFEDYHIDYHIKKSSQKSILTKDFDFILDKEFVRFFGFMLGDGWVRDNYVAFARGIYNDKNEYYTNILKKYCEYVSVKIGNKTRPNHPGSVKGYSKELKFIFDQLGFITGFANKRIPDWVWNLNKEYKKEFIKGLFDADGSWKWCVIGLSNEELITQYKILCQQTGIMCNEVKNYNENVVTDIHGVTRQPTYKLYVNFNKEFDLDFQKVTKIELFEENSNVWDLEVESEHHNFVANGIVVHNCLMEDAMLIHRIMRAPEHRIFKIDVGNIPPSEIDAHMEKIISRMKKVPYLDEKTGDYNLRFNLQNMTEDFYLPVRGGDSGTQIDTLPGMEFTGIDDIEYLKNKMLAALKIPKQFLGFDENAGDKSSLAMLDIRFARTITRIQKVIVSELTRIAILHLFVQGYRDASLVNFQLSLTNPSTIFEQEKIQIWSDKVDLASKFMESKLVSKDWLYEHVFELSYDDVANIKEQLIRDAKEAYRFKEIEENGEDPVANFDKLKTDGESEDGEMGSGGDDLGGGDESSDIGGDDVGGEEAAPEVPETPEGLTETSKIRLKASTSKETKRKNHHGLGQDLLGKLKNKRVSLRKDADKNRYKNLSILSLENIINNDKFTEKKQVLIEKSEKLSLLDEKNIL